MEIQQYIINTEEGAVLHVRFLTKKNQTVKIWDDEAPSWSSEDPNIFKVVSSNYDGTHYNVTINGVNTGIAKLQAVGLFKDESTNNTYQFTGFCEIKVVQPKVDSAYFNMTHKFPI